MQGAVRSRKEIDRKIEEFETFVEEKLKKRLKGVLDERDRVYERQAKILDLRNLILTMQEQNMGSFKAMVDIGCNFMIEAQVPDTSRIYVDVGLGFHVEMTLQEAHDYTITQEKALDEKADNLSKSAHKLRTHIKLVLEGISELQNSILPSKQKQQK
eukprot:TRINITY_DN19141_c0_g1_i1.p1 TRINITY_DN19141_c0_g1~~TRINITY_DN19141_c0_g1_i1.p1  ORF type:complete len:157 (+),score=42.62 TRINITY_DN19141_c0_g1_i1:79-549(+)